MDDSILSPKIYIKMNLRKKLSYELSLTHELNEATRHVHTHAQWRTIKWTMRYIFFFFSFFFFIFFFIFFIFIFILFYFFAHTLINNEWTPMKIHTQMIKPSLHTNVTWILTNKTTSQNNISEPLPMGWMIGKNVTTLHAVTCEKPPLKVEQR